MLKRIKGAPRRLRGICHGLLLYATRRNDVCFDEQGYRTARLRWRKGPLSSLWMRLPKLHFLTHFADDTATQIAVLGQELRVLVNDGELASRFDLRKPTVVFVTYDLSRTGAPKIVLEILRSYASTHNTVLFSLMGGDRARDFLEAADYCAFALGTRGFPAKLQRQMERICQIVRPELGIVNSIGSHEALAVLSSLGIPRLQLIHEIADIESAAPFETIARFADVVAFPAQFVLGRARHRFPSLDADKCEVLPQGVLEEADGRVGDGSETKENGFLPEAWSEDSVVVLGCGSVDFRKGVDLFLACAGLVRDKNPDGRVKFLWVGNGYDPTSTGFSGYLRYQIEAMVLGDRVHFGGLVRDMRPVFHATRILFLPSRFDPLPLVAQQAMGHGLPVVCFDGAGGIPDFLRTDPIAADGVVRYLDLPAAAEKILLYANEEALRCRIGEAGRRVAQSAFDTEAYFAAIRSLGRRAKHPSAND